MKLFLLVLIFFQQPFGILAEQLKSPDSFSGDDPFSGANKKLMISKQLGLKGERVVTHFHSIKPVSELIEDYDASRVSVLVVSGHSQGVNSVVYTIVETKEKNWLDVSWLFDDKQKPVVFRSELLKGDYSGWKLVLDGLDHQALTDVDDKVGKGTLGGRVLWFIVNSANIDHRYKFQNPTYSELPQLQTFRLLELLVSSFGIRTYGPARYDVEPDLGIERLK